MNELLKKIKKEVLNGELEVLDTKLAYEPGNGVGEYDIPDKLIWKLGNHRLEFSCKLGTSWYISGGSNIRIFTIGYKKNSGSQWYDWQHKYLDVTLMDDSLIKWVSEFINKSFLMNTNIKLFDSSSVQHVGNTWKTICSNTTKILGKELPEDYKHGIVRCPKIQYHYNDDIDEIYFIMEAIEIKFPIVNKNQKITSFIIQKRKDCKSDTITYSYNLRVTTQTNPPLLVSLSEEKALDLKNISVILKEEFDKYLKDVIQPQLPKKLRNLLEV